MEWLAPIVLRFSNFGPWGPVVFIAAYVIGALTLAPVFVLTFAAGALFGLWRGTLFVFVGAILGASAVYVLAATLARDRVMAWMDRDRRVAAVRKAVVGRGVWIMFLLRLSPLMPYNLLNYALALSGVRYRDYAVATFGMLPAIIMYVYYGKIVGDVAVIAAGVKPPRGPEYYVMLLVGLAATLVATTAISRAARRAIEEQRRIPE
jgi:uncharacterized membrane protein YdjX (TVP38/TMEM64 family)